MDLTLDQLLASMETSLTKSAEESGDKEDKKEMPAFLKKDEKEDGKDEDKKEDKEDESEKDEDKSEGQEKKASELGAALAREIMEKVASINLDTGMNKQASTAGQALAQALLKQAQTKKASAGDMTTTDGIAPGVTPNKNQVDNAQLEAEHASTVKPMPTGDGIKNTGTVNEIFDALIADALAQGAASNDQVHTTGVSAQEGAVEDHAVPNQVKVAEDQELADQIEKAAAVSELVSQGIDFDTAFELVKQAEAEINFELEKSAAMQALMEDGISFEDAVALVKQASAGDMTTENGIPGGVVPNKNQVDNAQLEVEQSSTIKPMPTGDGVKNQGSVNEIFDAIIADAVGQGAASTDQVHTTGVAAQEGNVEDHAVPNQVKVAAMNQLLAAGIDFDEASELVKQAGALAVISSQTAKKAPGTTMRQIKQIGTNIKNMSTGKKVALGAGVAAGIGAAGAGAAAMSREKKAAVDQLMEAGIDFDSAVTLVNDKAQELYGE